MRALYAGLQISNFVRDTTGEGALSLMVGNVSDPGGKRKYLLRTWSPDYGMATTWEELDLLTQEFSVMYRYFERFYIIDHISLLPPLTQAVFGWRLPPNSGITGVKTESNLSYEELQRSIWGALSDYPQTAPDVYVRQTDNSETDSDFYSFKTSVIVPAKAMLLRGDSISGRAFSQYFRFVLHSNSPLHLVVNVFELDDARYRQFLELRHSTAPDAKSQMTLFLQELWNNKL